MSYTINAGDRFKITLDGLKEEWEFMGEPIIISNKNHLTFKILKSKLYNKGVITRYNEEEFLKGIADGVIKKLIK